MNDQLDADRVNRIRHTESWLGAKALSVGGTQIKEADLASDELAIKMAESELVTIRQTLAAGAKKVIFDISDVRIQNHIRSKLTPEENARVSFGDE